MCGMHNRLAGIWVLRVARFWLDTRVMRKFASALVMILAGLFISAPAAEAAAAADDPATDDPPLLFCWYPVPSGWTRINYQFHSCTECWEAGEAGISRGDWPDYRCKVFPAGLDVVYYLHIPPAP